MHVAKKIKMTEPSEASATAQTASSTKQMTLTASYSGPGELPWESTQELQGPATDSVEDRTAYLASLREATTSLQGAINQHLTARMEEDKVKEGSAKNAVDDAKEEENYGEEVQEDEA
jgi:hypothetical protein